MDFLYPGDQEPAPGAQLTRTESMLISVGVHLLILLLLIVIPRYLPDSLQAFFFGVPAPPPAASEPTAVPFDSLVPQDDPDLPEARVEQIPLEFAYVKLPVDEPVAENKDALLLSDKNRLARQEVPTPENATSFTIDPHSEGDAITREIPDPSLAEGIESVEQPPPPVPGADGAVDEMGASPGTTEGSSEEEAGEAPISAEPVAIARAVDADTGGPGPPLPPEEGGPTAADSSTNRAEQSPDDATERGEAEDQGEGDQPRPGAAYEPSDDLREAISDMRIVESERKFIFSNPGYLRGANYGTMSFDTQDFPWGDYARKLYLIIRKNWYSRIPLAAREGIRGYACHRFVIEKGGAIIETRTVRPSAVPPFNKAALDAIHASDPLPPLPDAFPHATEGVTFCFFYNMHPAEAQ
ncbi:MAG: TonB family protein [Acidobacteria bacterium]|nr:TonB family protein [Acidobacteriota bacterium]